jgi:hypothetical protein
MRRSAKSAKLLAERYRFLSFGAREKSVHRLAFSADDAILADVGSLGKRK